MRQCRLAAILFVIFSCFMLPVQAADNAVPELEEEFRLFREALPKNMPEGMWESLLEGVSVQDMETALSFSALRDWIKSALADILPSSLSLLSRLMGILLCCGFLQAGKNAFGIGGISSAWDLCSGLCLSLGMADVLQNTLLQCETYIRSLTSLVNGVTPLACALTAASGNLHGAAVGRAALMLLYALFENLYTILLLPSVRVSFCLALVGNIGGLFRLDAWGNCIRRLFTWCLALLGVALSFVIGVQNVIARSADSLTMRTVKFALGSFIPLVGGALSDALGTAVSSLRLIRSGCGVVCMAAILLMSIPPICTLLLQRTVFSLCRGAAEWIGCEREGRLLGEMYGIFGNMLALIAMVSLLFLLVLTMMLTMHTAGG